MELLDLGFGCLASELAGRGFYGLGVTPYGNESHKYSCMPDSNPHPATL